MAWASNPLLHRPGQGSASPAEAQAEAGSADTGHIATVQAIVVAAAVLFLIAKKRAGFRVGVEASAGGRG